jgi:hypothetical protein
MESSEAPAPKKLKSTPPQNNSQSNNRKRGRSGRTSRSDSAGGSPQVVDPLQNDEEEEMFSLHELLDHVNAEWDHWIVGNVFTA